MRLVAITFIAHSSHVVRLGCHCKVVRTNNALVIIRQRHTTQLCKETILGGDLCPALIKIERLIATRPPYRLVLDHSMHLQSLPLVVRVETGTS